MKALLTARTYTLTRRLTAAALLLLSLLLYALTAEPTVSYWDCPEYVTIAARLEPGHPPGNPVWMLTARMFTLLAPSVEAQAYMVNLMSGVCSALTVMLLFLTMALMLMRLCGIERGAPVPRPHALVILGSSAVAAAIFAVTDSFWFSALEAEVYAFSAMLTALTVWLTFIWGEHRRESHSARLLVLIAYLTGLSIGVHQLNLLTLPVLALIIIFYERDNLKPWVIAACMVASLLAIAAILFAMMPGVLKLAGEFELAAVNVLGLPLHSGVILYALLTLILLVASALLCRSQKHRLLTVWVCAVATWLSGLLSFGGSVLVGAILTAAIAAVLTVRRRVFDVRLLGVIMWCAAFLFLGYSAYGIILVRGAANPPMNQGAPGDIFSLTAYLQRDQYGSSPLLKGPTPFSTPLYEEKWVTDSLTGEKRPVYNTFYRKPQPPAYFPADSAGRTLYKPAPRLPEYRYPPELDMWMPRIYSSDPSDIESYAGWTGMTAETMDSVAASFAVDTLGNAVGRLDTATGERVKEKKLRPTYLHNLMMLGGYQVSYMYFRYLLWNFSGRQNEVYAQGEADAGNFLTGIAPADRLMLQHPELLPADIGRENSGHHNYYMVPLLLGIVGIVFLAGRGKRGHRQLAVVFLLFVITGIAIVIYLNQTPGQPRERDYSFVGSFYAWCLWIGFGGAAVFSAAIRWWMRRPKNILLRTAGVLLSAVVIALPVWMGIENFPDHNRAGRTATRDFGANLLSGVPRDGFIFINGDNYTFPLWYLQETEGVRRDVVTVNLAYLSTPWYIRQLTESNGVSRPLRLSLRPEMMRPDIISRFSVVSYGIGVRDAREALSELFSRVPGKDERPRLNASALRFPNPAGGDSITVRLSDIADGHTYLRLNRLMMLDIVASNSERAAVWSSSLSGSDRLGMAPLTRRQGLVETTRFPADTLTAEYTLITHRFAWGGFDRATYADEPCRRMAGQHRRVVVTLAMCLLDRNAPGDVDRARRLADLSRAVFPAEVIPFGTHTEDLLLYSDALDLSAVYTRIYRLTGDRSAQRLALTLARDEARRSAEYARYIDALSPRYRKFTKASTRLTRENFYAPVQAWLDAGGSLQELADEPFMRGFDLLKERKEWLDALETRRRIRADAAK